MFFVSVWLTAIFAERGAKRKKKELKLSSKSQEPKNIQQVREDLPKDRQLRFIAGGCLSGIGCYEIGRPWEGVELPGKPRLFALT